uniref:N-acetylgalactosaminide beta-1,3-galactosyltransferase n=1 Tax=Eutreptiella gymnastica TaxID=73025 RepID=A0A7S4CAA2_9EUGL
MPPAQSSNLRDRLSLWRWAICILLVTVASSIFYHPNGGKNLALKSVPHRSPLSIVHHDPDSNATKNTEFILGAQLSSSTPTISTTNHTPRNSTPTTSDKVPMVARTDDDDEFAREHKMVPISDICIVVMTFSGHHRWTQKTDASWLRHTRHFFVGDVAYDNPSTIAVPKPPGHQGGNNPSEHRWIPAVSHANATCRPFKWLLLVDDDTYLVMSNMRKVLFKQDPQLPWYLGYAHPPVKGKKFHAACLKAAARKRSTKPSCCFSPAGGPCHADASYQDAGKPCYVHRRADGHYAMRKTHDNDTTVYPTAAFWHYGGAGSALSVGLLDSISHQDWLECGRIMVCEGGDKRVGTCIQNLANITITNLKGLSSHLPLHPLSQLLPEALSWHKVEPLMAREFYRMEKKILLNITA